LGLALLVGIAIGVLALGDDGDGPAAVAPPTASPATTVATATAAPSATPTLETAPGVTPAPESPEEQAHNLMLVEAPDGLLQFVTDGPYVVPGDAFGIFYLDIETQRIEGWYDLIGNTLPVASSGDNRFSVFQRRGQTFQGGATYPAGLYLADRETETVYRWDGDAELVYEEQAFNPGEIASRGDLVLFRIPVEDGEDWFSLLNVETGEVETAFEAEGGWGVISEDASRIAIAGEDVFVIEAASGSVERIAEDSLGEVDLEGEVELLSNPDGESFHVFTKPVKDRFSGVALRYTWEGDEVSKLAGNKVFPSADGAFVAIASPIEVAVPNDEVPAPWWVFTAYDTADGSELFRVVGVLPHYGFNAGNRWLADGSGIVVQRPPYVLTVAMRDGSFREFVGVPSPDSPEVFGVVGSGVAGPQGSGAVDAAGNSIVTINFQGGVRDSSDPWGDGGGEVRILVPHGGHGGPGLAASIVEPYVEQAPFGEETPLQLSESAVAAGQVDLYDEPAGTVIGEVAAPYPVLVHELALRCSGQSLSDPRRCPIVDSSVQADFLALILGTRLENLPPLTGIWARVTTADGREGWLLLEVQAQGI
jgi:hypothetical protein